MNRNTVNICHHANSSFSILVLSKRMFTDKYHFCIFLVLYAVRLPMAAHSYPHKSYMISNSYNADSRNPPFSRRVSPTLDRGLLYPCIGIEIDESYVVEHRRSSLYDERRRTASTSRKKLKKKHCPCAHPEGTQGGEVIQPHSLLASAPDGGQRLTSCSDRFTLGKQLRHPKNRSLGGYRSRP